MKRISSIVFTAALVLAACSKENPVTPDPKSDPDPVTPPVEEVTGVRIIATIKELTTEASFDVSDASWKFAFAEGDVLKVDNNLHNGYKAFTYDGTSFFLKDIAAPTEEATWYAYYPAESVDLTGQAGTLESAAKLYSVSGSTRVAAGAETVQMDLFAESSVLVVKNTRSSEVKIGLKRYSDDKYVSGLAADDGGMVEVWSEKPAYLATVAAGATAYIVAPAYEGKCVVVEEQHGYTVRQTDDAGFVAGKYYDITVGEYSYMGSAAGHDWVELSTGLKIATMNIGATKVGEYGDLFFWGDPYKRYSAINGTAITFNDCKDGLIDPSSPVLKFSNADFAKTTASKISLGTTLSGNTDIATFIWGPKWRMMKDVDAMALYNTCTFSSPAYTDPNNHVKVDMTGAYAQDAKVTVSPRFWLSTSDTGGYHVLYPSKKSIAKAGGTATSNVSGRCVRAVVNE